LGSREEVWGWNLPDERAGRMIDPMLVTGFENDGVRIRA